MKQLFLSLCISMLWLSSFSQTKPSNCACNCSYELVYPDSIANQNLQLSGYRFFGMKPKETEVWKEAMQLKGGFPITVSNQFLTELLDKVCTKKNKGTLFIEVDKEGAIDFAKLNLGYR